MLEFQKNITQHIETLAAAYAKVTDVPPEDCELVVELLPDKMIFRYQRKDKKMIDGQMNSEMKYINALRDILNGIKNDDAHKIQAGAEMLISYVKDETVLETERVIAFGFGIIISLLGDKK